MNMFSLSMVVILTGIIVVSFVLVLLSVVIKLYSSAVNKHTNKNYSNKFKIIERNKNLSKNLNKNYMDDEILAVISAAAYTFCYLGNNKKITIKKIKKENFFEESLWRTVGLIENTSNEFYESGF